ncbi:MAG TPA: hypothetical protein VF322_05580 [Gammaproteobacteria bacterium]
MFTKKLISPGIGLVSGLVAGLLSCQVAATEEVVVHGSSPVLAMAAEPEALRGELNESVRAFSEQLKITLENDIKRAIAAPIQLASGETATRS